MSAKSLLFQGVLPFVEVPTCGPCRQESKMVLRKDGRLYTITVRDKITVEDPYIVMIKAAAFAIANVEQLAAEVPSRSVRDFLIKSNLET